MDLHQLKTFVVVAGQGSITRASELLHLSQPAVSAHIKAMEDALGLSLFERTPRGMSLTREGQRLLLKAEETLAAHQSLLDEAARAKGHLTGKLRLGASSNTDHGAVGRLLTTLAERCPDVEVTLEHRSSLEVLAGLRSGALDAGFYNAIADPERDLTIVEVARFDVDVVAPPGLVRGPVDWRALAELSWIYPTASACCGQTAERLFALHGVRPRRIISVDREPTTRVLVTSGLGLGLLHASTSREAQARGEVERVCTADTAVRVLFAHATGRAHDPVVAAAAAIMRG